MYPEAGGSSSFARRAFNEFWSFFAAWGQMLNYIITVAISAFFVPHYLGVFWEPLGESPGRHHRRHHRGGRCSAPLNIVGVKESAGAERLPRARRLRDAGRARDRRRWSSSSRRTRSSTTSTSGRARRCRRLPDRDPGRRWSPTPGIETISNMAEEARDYGKTIPRAIGLVVVVAVAVIYAFLPAVALSAMPVRQRRDAAGAAEGAGRLRRRPGAGRCREHATWARSSTPPRSTSASWPRRSCSSRRTRA